MGQSNQVATIPSDDGVLRMNTLMHNPYIFLDNSENEVVITLSGDGH